MCSKKFLVGILGLIIFVQGCATLKETKEGAKEGAKKSWSVLATADEWIQEHLW